LWHGIWSTWCKIQIGLIQEEPLNKEERLYQPLFGNAKMCNQHGLPWGTKLNSKFCIWAIKGIQHLEDLWNEKGNECQTISH
jgi:hypothetical protein